MVDRTTLDLDLLDEAISEELGEEVKSTKVKFNSHKFLKKKGDVDLYYLKDSEIKKTSLLTDNVSAYLDWANFICPGITSDSNWLKRLTEEQRARKDFYSAVSNGLSQFYTFAGLIVSPTKLQPITYKGKGN